MALGKNFILFALMSWSSEPVNILPYMAKGTWQVLNYGPCEGKIIQDYPCGPSLIAWVPKRRGPFLAVSKREMRLQTMGQRDAVLPFEDGRRGPWAMYCWQLLGDEKDKQTDSPFRASSKEYSPVNTLILAQWHHVRIMTYIQNCKLIYSFCFKPLNLW